MIKKGVLISENLIQDNISKKVILLCTSIDKKSIYFTQKTPSNQNEYIILQKDNLCYCIWSYKQDDTNLVNLGKLFKDNWSNEDKANLFDDAIIYLYFLFQDTIIQTDNGFIYKKLISAFKNILSIKIESDFNSQFEYEIWKNFFIWLHKIEPSVLYSFFLCRYYRSKYFSDENSFDKLKVLPQLEKDMFSDPPIIKMPALYFNSIKFGLELDHTIIKYYTEQLNNNDPVEIMLISLFHFTQYKYSRNSNQIIKNIDSKTKILKIIKGRINQSSLASEFVVKCYRNQIIKNLKKIIYDYEAFEGQLNNLFEDYQQNSLAIEKMQSQEGQAFYQITSKENEQILLYALPFNVSLQTNQEYDNFNEKLLFNNFPLESKGNAQLDQQVQSIISCFKIESRNTSNLKYLIKDNFQDFFNYEDSRIFNNLLMKYSDPRAIIPFQNKNISSKINIFSVYQSIFSLKLSLELYKYPLTLYEFKNSLEEFIIEQKNNPIDDEKNRPNISFNKSTNNIDKTPQLIPQNKKSGLNSQNTEDIPRSSTDCKEPKTKKSIAKNTRSKNQKPQVHKEIQETEDKDDDNDDNDDDGKISDDDENHQKDNKKEEKTPKKADRKKKKKAKRKNKSVKIEETQNDQLNLNASKNFPISESTVFKDNEKIQKDKITIFIFQSDSPYSFIDSVSNFIIQQYTKFRKSFNLYISNDKFKVFDLNYLKLKILSDKINIEEHNIRSDNTATNIDLTTFDDMHIINIIKLGLFGILNTEFNSIFKDTNLSAQHLLFFFIFYKLEEEDLEKSEDKEQKLLNKFRIIVPYVEKMTEMKVETLSRLYFYNKNRSAFDGKKKKENRQDQQREIFLSFNPPPFHFLILKQFIQLFEDET